MLATSVQKHPFEWEQHVRPVCMAYNTSVQASTGYTPFYLMFGRQARLPVDLMFGLSNTQDKVATDYAQHLQSSLHDAYQNVRDTMGVCQQRQKELYDRKVHGEPFQVNDLVWLHSPALGRGQSRKLCHPYHGLDLTRWSRSFLKKHTKSGLLIEVALVRQCILIGH